MYGHTVYKHIHTYAAVYEQVNKLLFYLGNELSLLSVYEQFPSVSLSSESLQSSAGSEASLPTHVRT